MLTPIAARLQALQTEYETGQKMLAEIEAKRTSLMNTLLRIEGAIAVLKELETPAASAGSDAATPPTTASPANGQ